MLSVKELHAYYGKSHIVQGVSFDVGDEEVVGILGRNGVGKTTILRSILGLAPPKKTGCITFGDVDISSMPAHKVVANGLAYVPQGRRIFPRLTVWENLILPVVKGAVDKADINEVLEIFPRLNDRFKQVASTLSGGEQQMLAVARAIMSRPRLIIVDEPTEGLQPSVVTLVRESIRALSKRGIAVIIADQNLENVLELCDKVLLLDKGVFKYTERRENLSIDLLKQYLGVSKKREVGPVTSES